jgi:predicted DNA-binding protein
MVGEPPPKPKKPVAKGRKWKYMFEKDFVRKFPRLGAARLARRAKKRMYRYPGRTPPAKRAGAKFSSVMVPMDVFLKLKELSKFYKKSMSQILREQIEPMFDEAYKQAELLARIEANRKKDETPDPDKPRRRYNV